MAKTLSLRPAATGDLPDVLALLEANHLPIAGVSEHIGNFLLAWEGDKLVGCAGLEIYGQAGLLRSVAVGESHRSQTLGAKLTQSILDLARSRNLHSLSLLTTTAEHYFPRFGFEKVPRSELPAELQDSQELHGACSDTAIAMTLKLG